MQPRLKCCCWLCVVAANQLTGEDEESDFCFSNRPLGPEGQGGYPRLIFENKQKYGPGSDSLEVASPLRKPKVACSIPSAVDRLFGCENRRLTCRMSHVNFALVRTDYGYSHCASRVEPTDTTVLVGSKSQLQMSTRRSRVELREHHSISHQVIKVVVFQLPTPSGLALVHAQCLRSVYVANRCSGRGCVMLMSSWSRCHEFEPSTIKDLLCRGADARSICRGSKLGGPSPIALV
ncbi:uncharacterized protein TNCV_1721041 [Trichonephila clavipes]|nr:uncharacterized protein TNCV_1721041 [Trichonephila clavipes]